MLKNAYILQYFGKPITVDAPSPMHRQYLSPRGLFEDRGYSKAYSMC